MPPLKVHAPYEPRGDQPQAIAQLVNGLNSGLVHQTLLGQQGLAKLIQLRGLLSKFNGLPW